MAKKGRVLTGMSRRLLANKDLKHKLKIMIYKMYIRSSVTYASAIWMNPNNRLLLDRMEDYEEKNEDKAYGKM